MKKPQVYNAQFAILKRLVSCKFSPILASQQIVTYPVTTPCQKSIYQKECNERTHAAESSANWQDADIDVLSPNHVQTPYKNNASHRNLVASTLDAVIYQPVKTAHIGNKHSICNYLNVCRTRFNPVKERSIRNSFGANKTIDQEAKRQYNMDGG